MTKSFFFLILNLMSSWAWAASAQDLLKDYPASETRSQKVRDNSPHYWALLKESGPRSPEALGLTGVVHGDAHAGNFIVAPAGDRMKFLNYDIKDVGRGSYLFDLNRLILNTEAVLRDSGRQMNVEAYSAQIFEFYLQGLSGRALATPKRILDALNVSLVDYNQWLRQDESKDIKNKKGLFKTENDLQPLPGNDTRFQFLMKAVKANFPGWDFLAAAEKFKDRGGSKEMDRYWALARNPDRNDLEILEFKALEDSALIHYLPQADLKTRLDWVQKLIWPIQGLVLKFVTDDRGEVFMIRQRKFELLNFPYLLKGDQDLSRFEDMTFYSAYHLGTLHGTQMTAAEKNLIGTQKSQILKSLREWNQSYLAIIEKLLSGPQ